MGKKNLAGVVAVNQLFVGVKGTVISDLNVSTAVFFFNGTIMV